MWARLLKLTEDWWRFKTLHIMWRREQEFLLTLHLVTLLHRNQLIVQSLPSQDPNGQALVFTHAEGSGKSCEYCNKNSLRNVNHTIENCEALKSKRYKDRIVFSQGLQLCFRCLRAPHISRVKLQNVSRSTQLCYTSSLWTLRATR